MRSLREYVEETTVCLDLAEILSENQLVQGVHVEPHPDLISEWLLNKYRTNLAEPRWSSSFYLSYQFGLDYLDTTTDPEIDFYNTPPLEHTDVGDRLPLLVRIHSAPERIAETSDILRREIYEVTSRFVEKVPILVEDRSRCIMAIQPGDQIIGEMPGTIGGVLSDVSGLFGLTCSHVIGNSSSTYDTLGHFVGSLKAASILLPLKSGTLCNPRNSKSNSMDAALISLNNSQVPPATGLIESATYGSGQRVDMTGAKSGGPNPYRFGSLGLFQKVDRIDPKTGASHEYCFNNLSTIRPISVWGNRLGFIGHRARRGDSGAFIIDATATKWFGMLTAVDGTEGFFIDACDIMNWAKSQPGLSQLKVR